MWGFYDGMGWWMLFGGMCMVFFWAVVIGVVAWAVNRLGGGNSRRHDAEMAPLEMAKSRLAGGEISLEEFEEIRSRL